MKFIKLNNKQWYAKHGNHFYYIVKCGYSYEAVVLDLDGIKVKNTVRFCDTLKLAKQHLQKLCNLGLSK